jgi:uncharacterized spore protein YtfJ
MIKLPDNWQDGIQVRDWMSPVNKYGEVAILIFALKNKDGQTWIYQENNEEYPVTGGSFKGLDVFPVSATVIADDEVKAKILNTMYDRIVYHIPAISVLQETVIGAKNGQTYESVTNDEWEIMSLEGLTFYKDKV